MQFYTRALLRIRTFILASTAVGVAADERRLRPAPAQRAKKMQRAGVAPARLDRRRRRLLRLGWNVFRRRFDFLGRHRDGVARAVNVERQIQRRDEDHL